MITPQVGKHRQISLLNNLLKLPERQQHEPPLCDWCLSELEGGTRPFEGPWTRKISKCTTTEKERPQSEQLKTAHIFMWFFLLYTFSTKLLTPLPSQLSYRRKYDGMILHFAHGVHFQVKSINCCSNACSMQRKISYISFLHGLQK